MRLTGQKVKKIATHDGLAAYYSLSPVIGEGHVSDGKAALISPAILARQIGGETIGAHLAKATAEGRIAVDDAGRWTLTAAPLTLGNWCFGPQPTPFPCIKLMGFLFRGAYGRGAVPHGCRTCFKVQIKPRSLRELHAVHQLAETLPYAFKSGVGLQAQYQSGPYNTLFYLDGLAAARQAYAEVRAKVADYAPALGDVPITIKRGCTEYEIFCGPSDKFTFADDLPDIEAALLANLHTVPKDIRRPPPKSLVFMRWIQTAYQIGDETYKDFTNGQRLYPATVTYSPEET